MPLVTRTSIQGSVFTDTTEPTDKTAGSIWVDTSTTRPRIYVADGSDYIVPGIPVGSSSVSQEATI